MTECIVFAGTTEGCDISRFLQKYQVRTLACVATEYGAASLSEDAYLTVQAGRLDIEKMKALFTREQPTLVIDATHPYAAVVTENLKEACAAAGTPYLRLLRQAGAHENAAVYVESAKAAADYLQSTTGNVLLTTGSKELREFVLVSDFEERLYARVLSLPKVIAECDALGFRGKHLIAMQGPFSQAMNEAMLRQYDCRYLVTKDSGQAGGFQEKVDACLACGVVPVIIGRPSQEAGLSLTTCKRALALQFNLSLVSQVSLVGMGMGDPSSLTGEAKEVLSEAQLLIGAKRMVDSVRRPGQEVYYEYRKEEILSYIKAHPEYERISVVLSGDVGFYSGAKKLLEDLPQARVVCGISSVVYFMSKIREAWDDAVIVSAHGRSCNLIDRIRHNRKVFSILGTADGVLTLANKLVSYGLGDVLLYVGENLSYPEELIFCRKAKELVNYVGDPLCVVTAINEAWAPRPEVQGIPDDAFLRGKAPMTKEEVRCVSLSKLRLAKDAVCYDVGAGTGSCSVEMALRAVDGQVYAIEKKEEALFLLEKNRRHFCADNLVIVPGEAPAAMEALPAPTHAFIGGSSGNLASIASLLLEKNPRVRMVINCITLETVTEAMEIIRKEGLASEIVQLMVSRSKELAGYHMMMGENPIYIITAWKEVSYQ